MPDQVRHDVVRNDEEGILVVDGLGTDRRAAVTEQTRELLQIEITTIDGGNSNDNGIK